MANQHDLVWTNGPAFDTLSSQQIEGAVGEDSLFSFVPDTGSTNVSAWTIQFDVAPSDNRNPVLTVASGSITKGITGTITFSTLKAVTEVLPPRNYYWELLRTDSGSRKVLAFGNWTLTGSPSLFPGVIIPPTIIPLTKGGTGSDLSATGPGVLIQATAGANVSLVTSTLSGTRFLRDDLIWFSGAGIGSVTSVSVVTANGVSGSVANPSTTPAITIMLGDITPSSVNGIPITGASSPTLLVTGPTSITGTNTGDQTNIPGNAATVSVIDDSSDTTNWVMLATSQTGNLSPATDAGLTYDGLSNVLTVTGGVEVGGVATDASAILQADSTTKGFLPPRMTTTQRDAIVSPAEGLVVYNTTTHTLNLHDNSAWGGIGATDPLIVSTVIGGTAAGSTLTLQSTNNGAPSGDAVYIKTGGTTAVTIDASQQLIHGGTTIANAIGWARILQLQGTTDAAISLRKTNATAKQYDIGVNNTTLIIHDATANVTRLSLATTGEFTIAAPAGTALTVNGAAGQYPAEFAGSATTGQSFGPLISAGTNSSDLAFYVRNQAQTQDYFKIRGDGVIMMSPGGTTAVTIDASQNTTLAGTISSTNGQTNGERFGAGSSVTAQYGTALGNAATAAQNGVAVGAGATANSFTGIAIGVFATVATFVGSIVIGNGATATAAGQLVIGGADANINDVYIGRGVTHGSPSAGFAINPTGGSGTDIAGASLTLAGGKGTGSGAPGTIVLKTAVAGSTGTTLQTLATAVTIDASQGTTLTPAAAGKTLIKAAASRTAALLNFQTSNSTDSLGNVSGGCVADVFADVSTTHTDGTFDTLHTYTSPANALIANGDKIYFDYSLTTVAHAANTVDFKLAFAGVTILDSTALTFGNNAGTVRISGYIIRKSSTTARAHITFSPSGSATIIAFRTETYVADGTLTGLTLTGTNNLVLSAASAATGAASGDIKLTQATIHIDGFGG